MNVQSNIPDNRIKAANVLIELTIGEYLQIARSIINNNEYQRKKVIKSKIKEILRDDLLKGCSIPPIVLAVTSDNLPETFDYNSFDANEIINYSFENNKLLVIDGLQRTHVMLSIYDEFMEARTFQPNLFNIDIELGKELFDKFISQKIRAEIYVGLNRIGILYRMITLNTGQTTMSTRHLMEILYFDYQNNGIDGVKFITEKDNESIRPNTTEFRFKDVLDGFNSYLEKNENIVDRSEILDNIKTLNILSNEEEISTTADSKDTFKSFIQAYKKLIEFFIKNSNWKYHKFDFENNEYSIKADPFGKTAIEIFKRSQAFTGFGASIGYLKGKHKITLKEVYDLVDNIIVLNDGFSHSFSLILKHLDLIKEKSKKLGPDQRFYFRYLFQYFFDSSTESYLRLDLAVEKAYDEIVDRKLSSN